MCSSGGDSSEGFVIHCRGYFVRRDGGRIIVRGFQDGNVFDGDGGGGDCGGGGGGDDDGNGGDDDGNGSGGGGDSGGAVMGAVGVAVTAKWCAKMV